MRILVATSTDNGCYYVRHKLPYDELTKRGYIFDYMSESEVHFKTEDFDLAVFGRAYDPAFVKPFAAIKNAGIPVVYDLDDAMDLVTDDNPYSTIIRSWSPSMYLCLANADAVTTTTERMRKHLKKFTYAPVHVLPNCIKPSDYFNARKPAERVSNPAKPVRFGFAGSNTHLFDLVEPLKAFAEFEKNKDVELVLFGLTTTHNSIKEMLLDSREKFGKAGKLDHPAMQAMEQVYEAASKIKNLKWEKSVSIGDFHARLCELEFDFGLCPVRDTPFNACKSPIKAYEYVMAGAVPLMSPCSPFDVDTFLGHHAVRNDAAGWRLAFETAKTDTLESQRDWVFTNRNIEREAARWDALFTSLKRV